MDAKQQYYSLRSTAAFLGVDRRWLKGAIQALGITMMPLGQAKAIRRSDFPALMRLIKETRTTKATQSREV